VASHRNIAGSLFIDGSSETGEHMNLAVRGAAEGTRIPSARVDLMDGYESKSSVVKPLGEVVESDRSA
jgi:hypothetical protein